jgi:two-component system nitrogen regulation response regulator GlnG
MKMHNTESEESLGTGFSKILEKQLEKYFALHGEEAIPPGLYDRILTEVERSVFRATLKQSRDNQLKAARILGINRNTLRKKIMRIKQKEGNL